MGARAGHPVDSAGLVLPEPSWPDEPGSAGVLEPLRRWCNSTNRESGADAWRSPDELSAWLDAEGHGPVGGLDAAALTRAVAVRDALRAGLVDGDLGAFARAVGQLPVRLDATTAVASLVPAAPGLDAAIARLAISAAAAAASGELARLKSCRHCRWVFHDTSRNRTGRWCSMVACGGREKARAYRRRRAGTALASCLALVAAVPGLAACAADDGADDAVRVPGLTATLEQYREDEINGVISVKTTNRSSSTVRFTDLRLRWAGFVDDDPLERSTQLAPGVRFDIRVLEGVARCGDPPRTDGAAPGDPAVAVGTATIDGADPVVVAVPVDDERGILATVHRRSCQEQRLTWAADLRFGDTWTPSTTPAGAPAVLGTIELRRGRSDDELTVTRIDGSVLLRITPTVPAEPVLVLAPGEDAATIPILVEQSGNCSPHALIESKKTFIIPIGFAIGDDEPTAYVTTVDTSARPVLNEMINESCGLS